MCRYNLVQFLFYKLIWCDIFGFLKLIFIPQLVDIRLFESPEGFFECDFAGNEMKWEFKSCLI